MSVEYNTIKSNKKLQIEILWPKSEFAVENYIQILIYAWIFGIICFNTYFSAKRRYPVVFKKNQPYNVTWKSKT